MRKGQGGDRRGGRVRVGRRWGASVVLALVVAGAVPASADDFDSEDAGHPVRIAAYILHPVGVLLEYLILRPAHWIGSHEPMKTIFGHED